MTTEQIEAARKEAAKKLVERLDALDNEKEGLPSVKNGVKALQEEWGKFKDEFKSLEGIDFKSILKSVDELKSGNEHIRNMIRLNKGGIYVPGLGETKEAFSIHRAVRAITTKNWNEAGFEERVFKDSREAMTKGPGAIMGVDSQGGFFVPDQVIPDVIQQIYSASTFIALDGNGTTRLSVINGLTGGIVTIPKFLGGMIAYWIGEQDRFVESAVKVGNISLRQRKMGVLTRITDEMKRFGAYGFEGLMRQDMVRAGSTLIDWTVPYGTGTDNMPLGFFNNPAIKRYYAETHSDVAPSGSSVGGELLYDDLMNMQGLLEDANLRVEASYAVVSSPKYFRRRRQDKLLAFSGQTTGQAYMLGGPMLSEQALRDVIGNFATNNTFPTKNTAGQTWSKTPSDANDKKYGDILSGNYSEGLFARWGGLEFAEDGGVGRGFPTDESYIKLRMYADIQTRSPESFVGVTDAKMRDA
jgi:HK97 family phage major capsid protein